MILKNKNVAVLGFGIEGKDLATYLSEKGANVTIHDIKEKKDLETQGFEKFNFVCGKDYLNGLENYDVVFRSPGIYRYKKELVAAENKGIIISSATKLFFEKCKGKIIGITGTKGKGTTANLIYQSLINKGKDAYLLGNIGEPFLGKLDVINNDTWVVIELSSFQLIDLKKSPHIAIVLNITQDHLDWHKDLSEYIGSKKNIVLHQEPNDFSVISYDYETSKIFSKLGKGKKYFFSRKRKVKGSFIENDDIKVNIEDSELIVASRGELILKGSHILENVTASVCASFLAGADLSSIKKAITQFKGYEHRLEFVTKVSGVEYYNDSAATGPHSVIAAVECFDKPITLIMGGFDKGLSYYQFAKDLAINGNVKNIILIGDISNKLKRLLKQSKFQGNIINLEKSSMRVVVKKAKKLTEKGGIVLLSPASSSFDMFENYKDRGDKFKQEVFKLCR